MEPVFKLSGRLVDGLGNGIEGILLAIADEDTLSADDLLGLGKTLADGYFHVSFLASEFQQDFLEIETTPDIILVASELFGQERKAIFQKRYEDLQWNPQGGGHVDLGDVVFADYNPDAQTPLEGVEPMPGYIKTAQRLDIDNDTVAHCLAEVAPIVEKLTGWSGLLQDLRIDIVDDTTGYMLREQFDVQGIDPTSFQAKAQRWMTRHAMAPGMFCALYDPGLHMIIINRQIMGKVGLDALKIMMGHELVHVGQFKYTPGLKDFVRHNVRLTAEEGQDIDPQVLQERMAYNTELEGYAQYIETDYLKARYYPMATLFYHGSFTEHFLHSFVSSMLQAEQEELGEDQQIDIADLKAKQYSEGLERWRQRETTDGIPARFTLDLQAYPNGDQFV